MERRRARSDEIQLTRKCCRLVPIPDHLFLYQAIPFPSVTEVFFLESVA